MHRRALLLAAIVATAALGALVSLGSAAVNVPQSGWSWGNPTPQGNSLTAIDFMQGRGFAAGAAGTVLRTDDGGSTWTGLATGTSADLGRLQVIDPNTLVIQGANGCVLRRSDDGGTTFHKIYIVAEQNCPAPVQAFTFVTKDVGYLLLRDGNVLRTTDGGQTFARQTAVPGTQAGNNPSGNNAVDLMFTTPDSGIVFVSPPNNAPTIAFSTTDDGQSWKPVDTMDAGSVRSVYQLDADHAFAVGPNTMLVSSDGAKSWKAAPGVGGQDITSIRCVDPKTCLLAVTKGDVLLRTTDAGQTVTPITASSQSIFAAAFASATRVAAVGASGATVVSDDGGINYTPVSHDVGGKYFTLHAGPNPATAFATGDKGALAMTTDGGVTWRTLAVPTSAAVTDVTFADGATGYALDMHGALFKTTNGGTSWQTLDTGSTATATALAAAGGNVILVGPRGVRVAAAGGQFNAAGGKALRKAPLTDITTSGSVVVAFSPGYGLMYMSSNGGSSWKQIALPVERTKKVGKKVVKILRRVGGPNDVAFSSSSVGFVIDSSKRLFRTANGGRTWTELTGVGTDAVQSISMGSGSEGFMSIGSFATEPAGPSYDAFVLRTSDGGKTWRPQAIARGTILGVLAPSSTQGFALMADDHLFFTTTGGDVGQPSGISLKPSVKSFTQKTLKKAKGKLTIKGVLQNAVGGEQVVVSRRDLTGSRWSHQVVTVGANGGTFTTSWKIKRTSVFVAQWSGDSGRRGEGSKALQVVVKPTPKKSK